MKCHPYYNRWSEIEKEIYNPIFEKLHSTLLTKIQTAQALGMNVIGLNKLILEDMAPPYLTTNTQEHISYYFSVVELLPWMISKGFKDTSHLLQK